MKREKSFNSPVAIGSPRGWIVSTRLRGAAAGAFTLLELLTAMAVLALLLVVLMGFLSSATTLWRANENRVDSFREARAAMSVISRDFQSVLPTTNTNFFRYNDPAFRPSGAITTAGGWTNGIVFFLSALPTSAQWSSTTNKSDVCQVGYFVGYGKSSASTNSDVRETLNLYRYFLGSNDTFARLLNTNNPVFPTDLSLLDSRVELLARNIISFKTSAYTVVTTTNNPASLAQFSPSAATPMPDLIDIEIEAVNQETSRRLESRTDWENTNSPTIRANKQTFSTRIRLNQP